MEIPILSSARAIVQVYCRITRGHTFVWKNEDTIGIPIPGLPDYVLVVADVYECTTCGKSKVVHRKM